MGMKEENGMMAMENFLKKVNDWLWENPPKVVIAIHEIDGILYFSSEATEITTVTKFSYEGGTLQCLAEMNNLKLTLISRGDHSASFCATRFKG